MRPKGGRGRASPFGAAWTRIVLLVLLLALPARAGEHAARRDRSGEGADKRRIALSIRIAEARNRPGAKKYFQSVARQHKAKRGRAIPGHRGD